MIRLLCCTYLISMFCISTACSQSQQIQVLNPDFDRTIRQYLDFSVPTISCQELRDIQSNVVLLDARETKEYKTSHIEGARHVGFKKLNKSTLEGIEKDQPIVVYCSIGYRSEKIGEKLKDLGFSKVSNLYGSIFEWVNQELPIVDQQGETTRKLHTYNKSWSRWVEEGKAEKEW